MSDTTLEDFADAQAAEYGTYVATAPIYYGRARAFNVGDPVPASHVEKFHYDEQGLVETVEAAAARKAASDAAAEVEPDQSVDQAPPPVDPDNLDASTIDVLRKYAAEHEPEIELGDATLKADIVAAIAAALHPTDEEN